MSSHSRRRHAGAVNEDAGSMLARIDDELSRGYLEVEVTGLTLRGLVMAHVALLRGAWDYTLESVRSLLHPTAAL